MNAPMPCPGNCQYCKKGPPYKPCARMRRYLNWLLDADADRLHDETPAEWHQRRARFLADNPSHHGGAVATHTGHDPFTGRRIYEEPDPAKDYT